MNTKCMIFICTVLIHLSVIQTSYMASAVIASSATSIMPMQISNAIDLQRSVAENRICKKNDTKSSLVLVPNRAPNSDNDSSNSASDSDSSSSDEDNAIAPTARLSIIQRAQRIALAKELRLQEAKLKVQQRMAQLQKESKKEEEENQRAVEVVANAHRQAMQQLATLRSETMQLLDVAHRSGGFHASNGSDRSGNSHSSNREHGDGGSSRSSAGVSIYSGGSVCVASGCRDGYHSGKGGCDRSDNTAGMWGHD